MVLFLHCLIYKVHASAVSDRRSLTDLHLTTFPYPLSRTFFAFNKEIFVLWRSSKNRVLCYNNITIPHCQGLFAPFPPLFYLVFSFPKYCVNMPCIFPYDVFLHTVINSKALGILSQTNIRQRTVGKPCAFLIFSTGFLHTLTQEKTPTFRSLFPPGQCGRYFPTVPTLIFVRSQWAEETALWFPFVILMGLWTENI